MQRKDETATGNATTLGHVTWVSVEFPDSCAIPGGVAVVGSFTMTAANGDRLSGAYTTVGHIDAGGNLRIEGSYHVDGGTGRFAEATGAGHINAVSFLRPGLPVTRWLGGTINY